MQYNTYSIVHTPGVNMVNFANVSKVLERSMTRACAIKPFWCLNTFVKLAGVYHSQPSLLRPGKG
jgi:hypothetical protein